MFQKFANVVSIGTLQLDNGKLTKTAKSADESESIYLSTGTSHINIKASIEAVAEQYNLSKDPNDYFYEVVKAVKSGGFNNNFDGFPRDEQLRYLLKHATVTYRTFEKKPHHLNHKCFREGTPVVLADGTSKPIEQIIVGDTVLDKNGQVQTVTAAWNEGIPDTLTKVSTKSYGDLYTTHNHNFPVWAWPRTCACGCEAPVKPGKSYIRDHYKGGPAGDNLTVVDGSTKRNGGLRRIPADFNPIQRLEAAELRASDYLFIPQTFETIASSVTPAQARLLGYYIAEGSRSGKWTQFSFGYHERLTWAQDVRDLCETLGVKTRENVDFTRGVCTISTSGTKGTELQDWLVLHGGKYAAEKKLAPTVLQWPLALKRELVKGLYRGDGSQFYRNVKGVDKVRAQFVAAYTTVSKALAEQLRVILHQLGFPSTVEASLAEKRKLATQTAFITRVYSHFAVNLAQLVWDKAAIITESKERTAANKIRSTGEHLLIPIKAVEVVPNDKPVYNLTVSGSHSYQVNGGLSTFNCDVPQDARGFILDAAYNDLTPALDTCPQCSTTTKLASERTSDGMNCKKCGHIVKSEFVECLLAIDTQKDKAFAAHVKSGVLNATSMGCECQETECNVCNNIARTAEEFCAHIKNAKGTWFKRVHVVSNPNSKSGRTVTGAWQRSNIRDLRAALSACGYNSKCTETTTRVVAGETEYALSAENCRYVAYGELSRVAKPAEPSALTIEFLELTRRAAESNALAFAKSAQEGKITMSKFFVVAVDGSHLDTHAAPTLKAAVTLAQPEATSKLAFIEVEAPDEDSARTLWALHEKAAQVVPPSAIPQAPSMSAKPSAVPGSAMGVDSSVTVEVPDGMSVQLVDQAGNPVTPPQDPASEEIMDPMAPNAPMDAAPPASPTDSSAQTPESMGVMPPKSGAWAGRHDGFVVEVGKQFTIVANEADEPVFTVRNANLITSDADETAQALYVQRLVAEQGLLGAARVLKASFATDAADATGIGVTKGAPKLIGEKSISKADPVAEPESAGLTDKQGTPVNVGSERDESEVNLARDRIIAKRYERATATLISKHAAAIEEAKNAAFDSAVSTVLRALKVVAKRAALNQEESQLKAAVFSALTTEREVGKTAQGRTISTDPMPEDIAKFHIESAWAEGAEKEVAHFVERASVLARGGEQYLKTAEADLANISVPMPRIAHLAQLDDVVVEPKTNLGPEVSHEVRGSLSRMNFDGGKRTAFSNSTSSGRANGRQ